MYDMLSKSTSIILVAPLLRLALHFLFFLEVYIMSLVSAFIVCDGSGLEERLKGRGIY
jgi:hypothetical protein